MSDPSEITSLLDAWQQGDEKALSALSDRVYVELRQLARKHMKGERASHTLQATALVNEAFLRLINADINYQNRSHFFSLAGKMMRRILVDHARSSLRQKRGAGAEHITLQEAMVHHQDDYDLIDLHEALESLSRLDARKADILELQFFAGLTAQEIADLLGTSSRTVERDAQFARAWLHRELTRES